MVSVKVDIPLSKKEYELTNSNKKNNARALRRKKTLFRAYGIEKGLNKKEIIGVIGLV